MWQFSPKISLKKKRLPSIACGIALAGLIGFSSCSPVTRQEDYIEETTITDYTQGIITEVEEVEKDVFKITDETTADTKEDSRIIASYLDGGRDTFTLEEIQIASTDSTSNTSNSYRRSGINSVIAGGLMGYFMGRSMSSPTNPSAYKNTTVYNKSNTTTSNALRSTAKTTTTRTARPSSGTSGYGGGKSTRSYGG